MHKSGNICGRIFAVLTLFTSPEIFATASSDQGHSTYYLQVRIYLHPYFLTTHIIYKSGYISGCNFGGLTVLTNPDIFCSAFLKHWKYVQVQRYLRPHSWSTDSIYKSGFICGRIFGVLTVFRSPEIFAAAFLQYLQLRKYLPLNFRTKDLQPNSYKSGFIYTHIF